MDEIKTLIKLGFFLLAIVITYFLGSAWISIVTTPLAYITLLSVLIAIGIPVILVLLWLFIFGVLGN